MDEKTDVNIYAASILANKKYRNAEYRAFIANGYELNSLNGVLSPCTAILLLKKAIVNKKVSIIARSLLEYCDSSTITLDLIKSLKKLPKAKQYSYCSTLIHCNLTFTQMWLLNDIVGTEAFQDLFICICENAFFTDMDMRMLLDNKNYSDVILKYCISLCEKQFGKSKKIELARTYID